MIPCDAEYDAECEIGMRLTLRERLRMMPKLRLMQKLGLSLD